LLILSNEMVKDLEISPEIKEATKIGFEADPVAKEIDAINNEISEKQRELYNLQDKLNRFKTERGDIKIPWRQSALWCLDVDKNNPHYFLKSASGVYKCVAYKNKVDITPDMKNKVAVTLAALYNADKIGRIYHCGNHYYGLLEFFKDGKDELKEEYKQQLVKLIL
jgi:hypothetical protein